MKKWKKQMLSLGIAMLFVVEGCSSGGEVSEGSAYETMEGMEHLYAFNTSGYYFELYSESGKNTNGTIEMENSSEELYFYVESAGVDREIAVQIFIDYQQVPIVVNDVEYETYFFDAAAPYTEETKFHLKNSLDEGTKHKLTAIMTVSSDKSARDSTEKYPSTVYSLELDYIINFSGKNETAEAQSVYSYTEPLEIYTDENWFGLIVNDDIIELRRKVPGKELHVKANENIELQYQVGGYDNCEEAIVILAIDMKQAKVNGQDYLYCDLKEGEISKGILSLEVPTEPGIHELTGWVVKNPFDFENRNRTEMNTTYRITLNVTE